MTLTAESRKVYFSTEAGEDWTDLRAEWIRDDLEGHVDSDILSWSHPIRLVDAMAIQLVMTSSRSRIDDFINTFQGKIDLDWSACDSTGWGALHHAAFRGDSDIVYLLLTYGASPFAQDAQGQTALHISARRDHKNVTLAILNFLVSHSSNGLAARAHLLSIKDNKGRLAAVSDIDSSLIPTASQVEGDKTQLSSWVSTASSWSSTSLCTDHLEIDLGSIQTVARIAQASESQVHKAKWRGTVVAVKSILNCSGSSADENLRFRREIEIMMRLRHPNLVLLMGLNSKRNMLVLEYCSGGSLFDLLHRKRMVELSWRQRMKILTDIAKGVNYLHSLPEMIIHRDLKSLNVLLAEAIADEYDTPTAKVSDFGLSAIQKSPQQDHNTVLGTYQWMAPEIMTGSVHTEKMDTYSFGIVMYEVLSRCIPYCDKQWSTSDLRDAVVRGERPDLTTIERSCPESLVDLAQSCWNHDPPSRPSFDSIIACLARATSEE